MGRYRIALASCFILGRWRQPMRFLLSSILGCQKIQRIRRKAQVFILVLVFFSLKKIVVRARRLLRKMLRRRTQCDQKTKSCSGQQAFGLGSETTTIVAAT